MSMRRGQSWQLILADLSLILFLVTLSVLAGEEAKEKGNGNRDGMPSNPSIAAAQALYSPNANGPSLSRWLDDQSPDPRATLTIFAVHSANDHDRVWEQAQRLATEAAGRNFAIRVVITHGDTSEIYASLAYDEEQETGDLIEPARSLN